MRNLHKETVERACGNEFRIHCCKCNRKSCHFDFTDSNDIIITCKTCGNIEIIYRQYS